MGRSASSQTVRILILGAPGVGKNCLESRFTTNSYPPSYNPALTLSSRRFFTLNGRPSTPLDPITRPLETSQALFFFDRGLSPENSSRGDRPRSTSSTYSNPGSEARAHRDPSSHRQSSTSRQTDVSGTCPECLRSVDDSVMVELINYPTLQYHKERALALARGEYDAVLLVYDVTSRATFEAAIALYGEVVALLPRSAAVIRKRSSFAAGMNSTARDGNDLRARKWSRKSPVVVLVGNKCDADADELVLLLSLDGYLLDKEAEIQSAEIKERDMVHPLLRESKYYDAVPLSPRSLGVGGWRERSLDVRRSVVSADMAYPRTSVMSHQRSVRTVQVGKDRPLKTLPRRASRTSLVENWIETGSPTVEECPVEDRDEMTRVGTQVSESTAAARPRQVSRLEGEAASQRLGLLVPFLETSAKTGENVEELFEGVVRAVLKGMGREVLDGYSRECTCRGKNASRHTKSKTSVESTGHHSNVEPISVHPNTNQARSGKKKVEEEAHETTGDGDRVGEGNDASLHFAVPTAPRPRRESIMRRVKSLFLRRPQPVLAGVAA